MDKNDYERWLSMPETRALFELMKQEEEANRMKLSEAAKNSTDAGVRAAHTVWQASFQRLETLRSR